MQFVSAKKTTSSFSLKTVWLLGIIIFLSLTIDPIRIPFGNSNSLRFLLQRNDSDWISASITSPKPSPIE